MLDTAPGRTTPVATALERITATARREPKRPFPSFAHPLPLDRLRDPRSPMDKTRATGVDGHRVAEGMATLDWVAQEGRRQLPPPGYPPPPVRRVWIPKPGKAAQRPLGLPTGLERARQHSTAQGWEAISEPDFLQGSCGGRPGRRAHHALATLNDILAGTKVRLVREAALRNVFGSLDHTGAMRCLHLRGGDPRMLRLRRRWLQAGVLRPDGALEAGESGTPQGGRSSVLLRHVYLPYVVDVGIEKQLRKPLEGAAHWGRYLADFVLGFPSRSDALRGHKLLAERLKSFGLARAPDKPRFLACGRFAQRDAAKQGQRRPETCSFLGCTPSCARNRQGHFTVERRTERQRQQRAAQTIQKRIRARRHAPVHAQQHALTQYRRGHENSDGIAGHIQSLLHLSRRTAKLWRKT
jgi:RNA-directed DNA polymerase